MITEPSPDPLAAKVRINRRNTKLLNCEVTNNFKC